MSAQPVPAQLGYTAKLFQKQLPFNMEHMVQTQQTSTEPFELMTDTRA